MLDHKFGAMTENENYSIRPVTTDRFEDVHQFLEDNFFPCAPVSRVLGLNQKSEFWTWAWVRSCLMEEESLAMLDRQGAVKGVVIGKTSWTTVTKSNL